MSVINCDCCSNRVSVDEHNCIGNNTVDLLVCRPEVPEQFNEVRITMGKKALLELAGRLTEAANRLED